MRCLTSLAGSPISSSTQGSCPGIPLHKQDREDLLWIREPFLTVGPELPVTVVHGHTPQDEVSYGPRRIGNDTGAYATGRLLRSEDQ